MLTNLEAERALLCCYLATPSLLDSHPVPDDGWTHPAHTLIAAAQRWLYDAGVPARAQHVTARLKATDRLEVCGGEMAVYEIDAGGSGLTAEADDLHATVCTSATLRRQREHLHRAVIANERGDSAAASLHCAAALETNSGGAKSSAFTLSQSILSSYARAVSTEESALVPSCIDSVDAAVSGIGPGDLAIVAADTNVGKSSFGLTLGRKLAGRRINLGYISLEDSRETVDDRNLSTFSGVPSTAIRARNLSPEQHDRVASAAEAAHRNSGRGHGTVSVCLPGGTESDVIREMSVLVRSKGCRVLFVDYVGAIECSTPTDNQRLATRTIASRIKSAGARLGVPVWLASQITVERGSGKRVEPSKHDLRDSRDLAHIAELVIVLWREEEEDDAIVRGRIVKGKTGGNGVRMAFRRGFGGAMEECDADTPGDDR